MSKHDEKKIRDLEGSRSLPPVSLKIPMPPVKPPKSEPKPQGGENK
jgi:hypothetical protein